MTNSIFNVITSTSPEVPILLSVPHCGTRFPNELKDEYKSEFLQSLDDTDWFVDKLYGFAPSLGITLITANYSRWVIDLNRDPQSKPLYSDGRVITGLCPTTNFLGEPIYRNERKEISPTEVARRVSTYYQPYHQKLQIELSRLHQKFGKVLLWDCHSIRQSVPTIYTQKFPDLILGDADGSSASAEIISEAEQALQSAGYSFNHNHPFKGGYITRHFGQPHLQRHALQLEMSKINYMDDFETQYHEGRATKMQQLLKNVLKKMIETLH